MKLRSICIGMAWVVLVLVTVVVAVVRETSPRITAVIVAPETDIAEAQYVQEITVRYKSGVNPRDEMGNPNGSAGLAGLSLSFSNEYPNDIFGLAPSRLLTREESMQLVRYFENSGLVEFADPMFPLSLTASQWQNCSLATDEAVNDSCFSDQQWYLDLIDVEAAWGTDADVTAMNVAVIDSGIIPHPDLEGQTLPGYDFIGRSAADILGTNYDVDGLMSSGDGDAEDLDPRDEGQGRDLGDCHKPTLGWLIDPSNSLFDAAARDSNWHGTAVASIISAKRDNDVGISGIAPAVKIIPVRTLGKCIESDDFLNLVRAIDWASGITVLGQTNPNPANIINLSLGSDQEIVDYCPTAYEEAIQRAIARNIVVIASAGNDSVDARRHTPSNCPGVISVGAVGRPSSSAVSLANYSNEGADVVAPGGHIVSDYNQGILVANNTQTRAFTTGTPEYKYKFGQGTSYSAPIVSALIAMAKTKYRTTADNNRLTPAAIKEAVKYAATLGPQCTGCGNGLLTSTNLFSVLAPSTAPTVARSVNATGGPNTTNQGGVSWTSPLSNAWNPMTSYLAKAYSAETGGSVIDTCSPSSLSQLTCFFDDLEENTTYYVSVTSTAATSTESDRTAFTTFRRAAAPTGVIATAGAGKATIRWDEVTDMGDFNGFGLYEAIAFTSQTGNTVASTCYGNASCDLEGLTGGVEYWVTVSIMTSQHPGGSVPSTRIRVVPNAAPAAPTGPSQQTPAPNSGTSTGGTNTVGTGTQTAPLNTVKSSVGKTVKVNTVLKALKMKSSKGAKVSLKVSASSRKVCQIVKGSVKMIGKGTCNVAVTIKPLKGKSSKGSAVITA
jgi:serine protease